MTTREPLDDAPVTAEGQLLRLLTDAQAAMARLFEARARSLGLNRSQWRVVGGIYRRPGLTQTELASWLGIAKSPLGKIIDHLELDGLVERRPDSHDRRINRIYATAAVEPLLEPATALSRALEADVLQTITAPATFVRELTHLTGHLEHLVDAELKQLS